MTISHRFVEANGIRMHLAEAGAGPVVLMCHGWPESWYSWRHQLEALAAAGYHAIAPDMRGYGQTDKPDAVDQYTMLHLAGDMVGVLDAIGAEQAVIVGHDWGAPLAWRSALFRPDRFKAVVGLSVPFQPIVANQPRPTTVMLTNEKQRFYQLYFQTPGVAEAELEKDVQTSIKTTLFALSGDAPVEDPASLAMLSIDGGWLDGKPQSQPAWLTDEDVQFYVAEFKRSGFKGGLNWYRVIDRNWELLRPWVGAKIQVPALYVVGDRDGVYKFPGMDQLIPNLKQFVPKLRETIVLKGCGHWTQQERAKEVNDAILQFLRGL
jgi:pimeloyl-ACP methyl ester carboxylesterase